MAGVNKVILVGRLGKDPEKKDFSNGNSVVRFSIATSETWKDKQSGERKEKTEWHDVAIFSELLGKTAMQFLRKGSQVYVEGQLETRKWQDQNGAERRSTEVVLKQFRGEMTLLDSRDGSRDSGREGSDRGGQGGGDDYGAPSGGYGGGNKRPAAFDDDLNDDVPF